MTAPQLAPALEARRIKNDLRYFAAHETRVEDAVIMLRDALGLPSADKAAFYLPLDNGKRWKRANTVLRAQWLGEWLRAEFFALGDEPPIETPEWMVGPCE